MYQYFIRTWVVFFAVLFPVMLSASQQSDDLVNQGRDLMFKSGKPTYQGIIDANNKFGAAVQADAADQQAQFFYAVTQTAAFILEKGDGNGFQTIADILSALGIPFYLDELIEASAPFGELPQLSGMYNPPAGMPDGDDVRNILGPGLVTVIDRSLAGLSVIEPAISIVLTAQEVNDTVNLEIDYTDVLMIKGALNTLKTLALMISAHDLDGVDIQELVALGNSGMPDILPGFLNQLLARYPNFLKLSATGSADLAAAKTALLAVYDNLSQAKVSLEQETDSQINDLFVFEDEGDAQEFNGLINGLSELVDSLNENRPATSVYKMTVWQAALDNGDTFSTYFEWDVFGNGSERHDESDFSATIDNLNYQGSVTSWDVSSDGRVSILLDYMGYKRIVVTGAMNPSLNTFSGTAVYQEYNGSAYVQTDTSPFSATLVYQYAEDPDAIDFNAIFGNTGKSQLVIRDVLPELDPFGEPIAGTFPEPVFNGVIPGMTNDDLAEEFELVLPYRIFTIPDAAITLDGSKSDWPQASVVASDPEGDLSIDMSGLDIVKTYLAKDSQYLYVALDLAGDPVQGYYGMNIWNSEGGSAFFHAEFSYNFDTSSWGVYGYSATGSFHSATADMYAIGSRFLEFKLPLADIGDLNTLGGSPVNFLTFFNSVGDYVDANVRLAPVFSITGSASIPDGYTGGNIYYYLSTVPGIFTADTVVLGTYVESDGSFVLEGASYSANPMYLYALWDKDGNGILSSGDAWGSTSFSIQDDVETGPVELTNTISDLPLGAVSVRHVSMGPDISKTWFDIEIGPSFSGNLPGDIERITVIAPNGQEHQIWPDGGGTYLPDRWFWHEIPGAPDLGAYTFVVTAKNGTVGIKKDVQKSVVSLPVVDAGSVQINTASKTPTFSWNPVLVSGRRIAYRLEIRDPDTNTEFRSKRQWDMTSCTAPELVAGKQYQFRIVTMDHADFEQVNNRSQTTEWTSFTMDSALSHATVPAIDLDTFGAAMWGGPEVPPGIALWVNVIDHDGVAYDGSSHTVSAHPVDADGNSLGSSGTALWHESSRGAVQGVFQGYISPNQIPEGTKGIRFYVNDPDGNNRTITDMISDSALAAPQDIGLVCAVNGGTTPTFTWNAVPGANQYVIRIFDENGGTFLRWRVGNTTSATIPPGYLNPETTYSYQLQASDSHQKFNVNSCLLFPSGTTPEFTTGAATNAPFVHDDAHGAYTLNHSLGTATDFRVKVYDAQGVDNIATVKAVHPDGTTETPLHFDYQESEHCAVFTSTLGVLTPPQSGSYHIVATDKDGNTSVSVSDVLTVNSIGYPAENSLRADITSETGVLFDWDDVEGAAFYLIEICDSAQRLMYSLVTTDSQYSLAPGFLKSNTDYRFRLITYREFYDQNVDNLSLIFWGDQEFTGFVTGPGRVGGTHLPQIRTGNQGALVMHMVNPISGQPLYRVMLRVTVSDMDGVLENIRSVTVQGPQIADSLKLNFNRKVDAHTAEYQTWLPVGYENIDDIPEGVFTFRVEDLDGNVAETSDTLTKQALPFAGNLNPADGTILPLDRPVISWDAPEGGPFFYTVRIFQYWDKTVHESDVLSAPFYVVPDAVLTPGKSYYYQVLVMDKDMRVQDGDNVSFTGVTGADLKWFSVSEALNRKDLGDAVRLLNILSGKPALIPSFHLDMDQDDRLDLQDLIHVLQEAGSAQ